MHKRVAARAPSPSTLPRKKLPIGTRLAQAAVEQLEDWAERILDAASLDAVFTQDTQ